MAHGAACTRSDHERESGRELARRPVRVDGDDRPDHGYFPFFRYEPAYRPALAQLEAEKSKAKKKG